VERRRIACLVSGGLDSGVLVAELSRTGPTLPVYVRAGLSWEDVERRWLDRFLAAIANANLEPLRALHVPVDDLYRAGSYGMGGAPPSARDPDASVYLPGRTLLLTVKLGVLCALEKIPTIAIGSLDGNPFPDATPTFYQELGRLLSLGLNWPVEVAAPFRPLSKVEVIRRGRDLPLECTFSCADPVGELHCGRCNKCGERMKAFREAGVPDRTRYAGTSY
jgi:7-cyano-7-deazaguanine synthase